MVCIIGGCFVEGVWTNGEWTELPQVRNGVPAGLEACLRLCVADARGRRAAGARGAAGGRTGARGAGSHGARIP